MASESKTTTNHNEIKKWAESRGGKPATVKSTESNNEAGVLRIDFPGYSGAGSLEEISWDEFFKKFDEKNLAFLYQDHTSSGEESRFFKLVSRDTAEHKSSSKSHSSTATAEPKGESKTHTSKMAHKGDERASVQTVEHKTETKKADDKPHTHKAEAKKADDKAHTHKDEHKSESKKSDEKAHKAHK